MGYEMITLRELVGTILVEEGKKNPDIFVLDSDLAKSTTTNKFQAEFPDRFFRIWNCGAKSRLYKTLSPE